MLTDEELYSRYLLGDNSAIDELLVRHKDGLTYFLYGVVHSLEDAEDLMMDTFALLLAKHVRFRNDSSFKTWLYGIGRNLANNYLRKHKASSLEEMTEAELPGSLADPDISVLTKERNNHLYNAMRKLPPKYAEVLYLSYFGQMETDQIAQVMKCSAKQVYNLKERAKKQLKELVDESISL